MFSPVLGFQDLKGKEKIVLLIHYCFESRERGFESLKVKGSIILENKPFILWIDRATREQELCANYFSFQ